MRRGIWACVAAVAGCAIGPDHTEPTPELAASFVEAAPSAYTEVPVPSALWASFADPDLDALIELALARNPTIGQALATLNQTRALSGLALYSWFPSVSLHNEQERSRQSALDPFGFPAQGTTQRYRTGFDTVWEIDLFGRLRRQQEAIRRLVEADTAALGDVRLSIVAEVAQTYFALRGSQQRLVVQQRNLDNVIDNTRILEASLQAGRGTALDVARARALERSWAALVPQTQAAIARSEQRLGVLTAQPVAQLRSRLAAGRELPPMPELVAVGTPQQWLRRRPDVRAAERRLAVAVSGIGVEISEYYPRLTLLGDFGWTGRQRGDVGSAEAERWRVAPLIAWRIPDFGRIRQMVLAAQADAQGAYAAFEATLLRALEEVENGLAGYRAASLTTEALAQAVDESRIASGLARLRFDNGASDYLTVLDAERTQLELEDRYAVAVTDRATALAALYKALGGDFAAPP